jgi:hypothetical protein
MLTRFEQSVHSLMSEPNDVRLLPTCDLSATDAACIKLLIHELQTSGISLVVQAKER